MNANVVERFGCCALTKKRVLLNIIGMYIRWYKQTSTLEHVSYKKNNCKVYLISVAQSKTAFSWTNQTSPFYYDKQQNISDSLY